MLAVYILVALFSSNINYTFELVNRTILAYDWSDGVNNMAIMNGRAYLTRPLSYEIYVVDLARKQEVRRLGGQGKGPGEFDMFVDNVHKLNDGLAVTSMRWIHFFDERGTFKSRVYLKNTFVRSVRHLQNGQLLVSTTSSFEIDNVEKLSNVGILKSKTSETINYDMYGNSNKISNMVLNDYVIDADESYVVIGQRGSNELRFYTQVGTLIQTITLAGNPREITFREQILPSEHNRISEQLGIKRDLRSPSFSIVSDLALTPKRTIVQGIFNHNGTKKSHAIIEHGSWKVDYVNTSASCRSMMVENDLMYCLNAPPNATPQIDVYRIKAAD